MNREFENWWDKSYAKLVPFTDDMEYRASKRAAKLAWEDAYKMGFADGKRAAMGIIDRTFDEYLAGKR